MVNLEDFIKRLELILDYYSLSASGFADKIGVQRSSLSHLLSGRNKPSLDFILKIITLFPEVDLYWILNGKGSFPKNISQNSNKADSEKTIANPNIEPKVQEDLFSEVGSISENKVTPKIVLPESAPLSSNSDKIEKIVIFYTNGKFMEYNPK